jgi:hypothetical protein
MRRRRRAEMIETWHVWKILRKVEGEEAPRLLTPMSDPYEDEYPMDLLFETPKEALDALDDWSVRERAVEEEWLLCKQTTEVLHGVPCDEEVVP